MSGVTGANVPFMYSKCPASNHNSLSDRLILTTLSHIKTDIKYDHDNILESGHKNCHNSTLGCNPISIWNPHDNYIDTPPKKLEIKDNFIHNDEGYTLSFPVDSSLIDYLVKNGAIPEYVATEILSIDEKVLGEFSRSSYLLSALITPEANVRSCKDYDKQLSSCGNTYGISLLVNALRHTGNHALASRLDGGKRIIPSPGFVPNVTLEYGLSNDYLNIYSNNYCRRRGQLSIWLQISAIKVSPDHFRRILHINPFDTPSHFQSGLCRKPVQSASSSNVSRVSTPISRSYELLNHTSSNLNEAHCQAPFETKDYAPIEPLFSQEITSLEGAPDLAIFNGPLLYEFVMPTPVGLIPPLSSPSHPSSNGTCTQLPSFVKNLISPDTAEIKQNTYVPWNPPDSTCFSIKSPAFPTSHLVTSNSYLRQFYHRTQNKYVSSPPLPSHFATLSAPLTATAMFERVPNNLTTATVKQECKRVMPNVVCVGDQSTILPGPSGAGQVAERQEIRADESNRLSMVHMRPTLNVLDGREGSGGSEFNASKNGYDYPDILNELPLRSDKLFDGHIISENQEFNSNEHGLSTGLESEGYWIDMTPSLPRRSAVSTVTSPPKPDTSFIVKTPNETYELADSHIPASNLAALSGHVPHDPLLPSSAVGLPSTPQEFGRVDITGLVKTPASSKSLSCLSLFLICFCYGRWCSPSGTKITQSSELQAQQAKQTMAKTKSKKNRKDKKSEKTVKNRPQTAMLVGKSGSGIKGPSVPFINCQSCFELKHSTNGGTDIGEKAMRQATVYREIQMDRSAQWAEDYSDQVQSPNNVTLMQSREDAQNPADLLRAAKLSLLDIKSAVIYRDLVDPSTWLHDALVKYLEQSAGVLVLGCRLESRPVMKGTTQEIKKDALEIGSTVGAVRVLVVATRQLTVRDLISKCSRKSTASSLGNNAYIKNDRSCELKASAGRAKADDKQEENIVEEYIKNGAKSSVRKMEVREVEKHELCTNIKENESDSLFSLKMETGCTLQNPSTDHPTGELSIKDSNRGPQSSIPSSSSIAQELEAVFASDLAGTRLTRLGLQGIRLEVSLEDEEVEQALLELES